MSKRILLADDSLTIQKVVELTFMDEDFEVEAVGSGDEAISSLSDGAPDIVIADVHMPGASGYEVCRQAKASHSGLPVLLLVGTFEALDEDEMVACGADGNLKKPFDSQELLQLVQRMTAGGTTGATDDEAEPTPAPAEGLETTAHDDADEADPEELPVTGFDLGTASDEDFEVTPPDPPPVGFETVASELEGDPELEPVDLTLDEGEVDAPAPADEEGDDEGEAATGNETVFIDTVTAPDPAAVEAAPEEEAPAADTVLEEAVDPAPEDAGSPGIALDEAADDRDQMMPEEDEPAVDVGHDLDVAAPAGDGGGSLSDADVERIARRVVEMMSDDTVREVAWDVIPDMAEVVIKDRIREIEAEAD